MTADESETTEELALKLERERKKVFDDLDSPRTTFGVLAGSAFVAFALQEGLGFLGRIHVLLGVAFSVLVVASIFWSIRLLRRDELLSLTRSACVGLLAVGLFGAIVVAGWASLTLHTTGLSPYSLRGEPSIENFTRLYFYTLADLVPALDIPNTLHLNSPVEASDLRSGWPVLAFRIFVLWFVLDTFTHWRKRRIERKTSKSGDDLMFLSVFLLLVALFTSNLR